MKNLHGVPNPFSTNKKNFRINQTMVGNATARIKTGSLMSKERHSSRPKQGGIRTIHGYGTQGSAPKPGHKLTGTTYLNPKRQQKPLKTVNIDLDAMINKNEHQFEGPKDQNFNQTMHTMNMTHGNPM